MIIQIVVIAFSVTVFVRVCVMCMFCCFFSLLVSLALSLSFGGLNVVVISKIFMTVDGANNTF